MEIRKENNSLVGGRGLGVRPKYSMGRLHSKYLILDVLTYSFSDISALFNILMKSSRSLRTLLIENKHLVLKMIRQMPGEIIVTNYVSSVIVGETKQRWPLTVILQDDKFL
jgi:hypothetical protein